MKTDI